MRKDLKSIVVLGALNYVVQFRDQSISPLKVESPKLPAKYGLLCGNQLNYDVDWEFIELFTPHSKPKTKRKDPASGQEIFEYNIETEEFNVMEYTHFLFVQTYEDDPAKAFYDIDLDKYSYDYIIKMDEFSKDILKGNTRIKVRANIQGQNSINFRILSPGNRTLYSINNETLLLTDLGESNIFTQSMWPYMRQKSSKRN